MKRAKEEKTMMAQPVEDRPDFLERHYTLKELSASWRMSVRTLTIWFKEEPGVIRYGAGKLTKGRKRTYVSIRVPESVARRVYKKKTNRQAPK